MSRLENFAPSPLPVINAVCEEVGLVEVINEIVDWDETQTEISPGSLTAGLVMNFLTDGDPMHRLSDFFENKDPQNLFVDDITTEDFYDQRFGWTLDKIADVEPRNVLNPVIAKVVTTEGIDIGVVHADTTSKSVHGEYERDGQQDDLNNAKGYSRGILVTGTFSTKMSQIRPGTKNSSRRFVSACHSRIDCLCRRQQSRHR